MATTVAATSLARDYDLPWVEKYRPHKVADIVGNHDVVARLQVIAQGGNMPNLIFSVSKHGILPSEYLLVRDLVITELM